MNPGSENPNQATKGELPLGLRLASRVLRQRYLVPLVLLGVLVSFGTYQYRHFILAPSEAALREVALTDLTAEHWYETEAARQLTKNLARLTDSRAMRLACGLYYREYKHRYAPGVKLTQYIQVGPEQYPAIFEMVTAACAALGTIDGEPMTVPSVYVGWTGARTIEVTNFQNPSILIGNDFLWAFTPEELRYLVARQVGHIHCRHVYLLDATRGVRSLFDSALPADLARLVLGGLGGKLLEWQKEAQISADRAGLLVTGDIEVACHALIKLNILASVDDFYGQPNPEAYAAQAADLSADRVTTASAALAELKNPNPFLTVRVKDLLAFYEANQILFKDRESYHDPAVPFDPGVYEDDEPAEEAAAPSGSIATRRGGGGF